MEISLVRLAISACAAIGMSVASAGTATPTEQQAIVQTGNGGPEVLSYRTIPVLEPAEGQVLIKVYAAAVNPFDWKMRQGGGGVRPAGGGAPPAGAPAGGAPMPGASASRVPGLDVSGVIEKLGAGVTRFKVGDPVFSMIGMVRVNGLNGGYSQYVIAPASNVIAKPKNLSHAEAAGLGTSGMTAMRLATSANVTKGQRVFIDGIAGGVGSAAAQIAKAKGAYVLGTASARHNAYLKSIGVDEVIDYTQVKFDEAVKLPVDVVIETVSADNATRALKIMKWGGTLVTSAGAPAPELCTNAGVKCPVAGPPGAGNGPSEGDYLAQVGELARRGKFKVNIDATFPLEKAAEAQEENRNGGTSGKIIIMVDAAKAASR